MVLAEAPGVSSLSTPGVTKLPGSELASSVCAPTPSSLLSMSSGPVPSVAKALAGLDATPGEGRTEPHYLITIKHAERLLRQRSYATCQEICTAALLALSGNTSFNPRQLIVVAHELLWLRGLCHLGLKDYLAAREDLYVALPLAPSLRKSLLVGSCVQFVTRMKQGGQHPVRSLGGVEAAGAEDARKVAAGHSVDAQPVPCVSVKPEPASSQDQAAADDSAARTPAPQAGMPAAALLPSPFASDDAATPACAKRGFGLHGAAADSASSETTVPPKKRRVHYNGEDGKTTLSATVDCPPATSMRGVQHA